MKFVNEHLITKQNVSPTVSNGTLNGNDIAGKVNFTSIGNSGCQTTITFRFPYKSAPIVVLTPVNVNSAVNNIGYYATSNETSFSINAAYTSGPIEYSFSYMIMQVNE